MIARLSRSLSLAPSIDLSPELRSRLLIVGLSILVLFGFLVSLFAPFIFASAFSGVHVTPSDLTPFMNGW